jgi:hypothetical protein
MNTTEMSPESAASGPERAIQARRTAAANKVAQVNTAITRLVRQGRPLSRSGIAESAGVSRTFVYENDEARDLVDAALARTSAAHDVQRGSDDAATEAVWRQRALNAEHALAEAREKATAQRATIADLLGQLRDPDGTSVIDDRAVLRNQIERLREENVSLRQAKSSSDRALEGSRQSLRNLRALHVAQEGPGGHQTPTAPRLTVVPVDDNT